MKKKIYLLYILIPFFSFSYAQDPLFLNSNQSLVYLNPSFAGSNGHIRGQSLSRYQWPSLSSPYYTSYTSVDAYLKPLHAGIAGSYMRDNALKGALNTNVFSLSYAQHLSFLNNKLKIIPSLQASYVNRNLDDHKLSFGDLIDPRLGQVWNTNTAPAKNKQSFDLGSGLLVNYKNFYFGAAVFHMNKPHLGFKDDYAWPTRLSVHGSYNFHLDETSLLQVLVRYDKQQNVGYLSTNVNALLAKHFIIGAGYRRIDTDKAQEVNRWNDIVNINAGVRTDFFTLCLGYDTGFNKKRFGLGPASWELQLAINFRNRENRRTITNFETW